MEDITDIVADRITRLNCYRTVINDVLGEGMKITWFSFERQFEICKNKRRYENTVRRLREIIYIAIQDQSKVEDFFTGENGR